MATKKKSTRKRAKKKTAPKRNETIVDKPSDLEVRLVGSYPNPMWLKGLDKNNKLYKIRVPKRLSKRLLNKRVTVQPIDGELEEYYKYEP